MALLEKVSLLYNGLTSDKVTERKKSSEALREHLTGGINSVASLLTEQQSRGGHITWNSLFVKVHEMILKDVEKLDSGKGVSTHETLRGQCSSLLIGVITGANKAKCYISSDKLLECCLEAFKNNRVIRHFGETYISVLFKYVLQVPHYLNVFSPYEWADILEASIELHSRPSMDCSTVVKLVRCVLEEGTSRCQLALAIRDSLQPLGAMFLLQDVHKHHYMQENLLRIAIAVINNVAPESRLAVCIFTEAILPNVIQFYEQSSDIVSSKKKYLFSFLHLCLVIHHPGPKLSLVGNWTTWSQVLHNMQQIVRTEATLLANCVKRLNSQQVPDIPQQYITLAIEVYHQIFSGSLDSSRDIDETGNPPKRIKLELSDITTYLALVQSVSINNYYPWIWISASYFKEYSTSLSLRDKREVLDLLLVLFSSDNYSNLSKSSILFDSAVTICEGLLEDNNALEYSTQLLSLWNICVRKSTENALFEKCHNVLQSILKISSLDIPMESIVNMYSEKNIPGPYCENALQTLTMVLSHQSCKIVDKSTRTSLAQWILNSCLTSLQCQKNIPFVLFQICINENISRNETSDKNSVSIIDKMFDDVRFIILKSDFDNGLLFNKEKDFVISLLSEKCVTVLNDTVEYILNQLFSTLILESNTNLNNLLKGLSLMLKIFCLLEKYKFNDETSTALLSMLKSEMSQILNRLPQRIKNIKDITNKDSKEILYLLELFYQRQDYTCDIFNLICEETTKDIIESFCTLLSDTDETDLNDSMELMNVVQDESESCYKKTVLNILVNFCTCDTSYRIQILSFILGTDMYDFSSPVDFEMAVNVLNFIVDDFDPKDIPIGLFLQVLQEMCKKLYRNNASSFTILTLLYRILKPARQSGTSAHRENIVIMLNSFLTRCNNKFYTPKTMALVLKSVSWIQNSSGVPEWGKRWDGTVLQCLSNTIHSIRLYGCLCIGYDLREATVSKFNSLVSTLPDLFLIDERDLPENVISDESANRTSTVLHCLASVSVSSPIWDKAALVELLKISHRKKLSPVLVGKVFNCISKYYNISSVQTLMIENLEFFVNSWLSSGLNLDDFPNYLLLCDSTEEFFREYKNVLIPYDMLWSSSGDRSPVLQLIMQKSDEPLETICKEFLVNALALVAPYMVHHKFIDSNWNPTRRIVQAANNLYLKLCEVLKENFVIAAMTGRALDILKTLLACLCDEEELRNETKWTGSLPHLEGPVLSTAEFSSVLNWFNEKSKLEIIFHLCCDNPSAIQQLLLHLWENIERQTSLERKLLCLHQYWKFCHMLPLLTNLNTFIGQFTIQSLLHIIEKYGGVKNMQDLATASCRMLYSLLRNYLPSLAKIVSRMLSSIVYTVSQAISKCDQVKEPAIGLLVFLIIDMHGTLPGIQYLDSLPDKECFSKLNSFLKEVNSQKNDNLNKQIESFIQGGVTGRYEGLKLLHSRLTASQNELINLFNDLKKSRGFSEVCADSILHRLACILMRIAGNKQDMQCSVEALRCLGVLGVSDYQTPTIQLSSDPRTIVQLQPSHLVALHALQHLPSLYSSNQPSECRATAKAITSLLKYKEGVMALDMICKDKDTSHMKDILVPFMSAQKCWPSVKIKLNNQHFETLLSCKDIWSTVTDVGHSKWIVELVVHILNSFLPNQCFLVDLVDICKINESFSERIIPALVGLIFSHGTEQQIKQFIQRIQQLFDYYFKSTFNQNNERCSDDEAMQTVVKCVLSKKSIECLLEIVKFAFVQKNHYQNFSTTSSSKICLFDLNLLACSWAACEVGHHLSAVYFAELWCVTELDQNLPSSPDKISQLPKGNQMLSVLRKCYECMCDDAALTGCGSAHLLDPKQRMEHYLRTGSYMETLLMHDCTTSNISYNNQLPNQNLLPSLSFASSLQTAGLYQLAGKYLDSQTKEHLPALVNMKYECCWKLGDWSMQIDTNHLKSNLNTDSLMNIQSNDSWPAYHYVTLKDATTKNVETLGKVMQSDLKEAREFVALSCMQNSLENSQSVYELCAKLQVLHEMEYFTQVRQQYAQSEDILDLHTFLSSWKVEMLPPFPSFKLLEKVLSQRIVILKNLCLSNSNSQPLDCELVTPIVELLLQYADLALTERQHQLGVRWISVARHIVSSIQSRLAGDASASARVGGLVVLAEGSAAWRGGHCLVAQHLLKTYIADESNYKHTELYAGALRLYGSWMVESRSESALDILQNYLTRSLQVLGSRGDPKERLKTYVTIAKFSDGEYKQVNSYMKSAAFVNKIKCMEQCKVKFHSLKEQNQANKMTLTKDEKKVMFISDGQSKIDQIEISNTKAERDYYLQLAIKYYLTTLLEGDTDDLCIFRVISLWLENPTLELTSKHGSSVSKTLTDFLKSIPSRKLLPVVSQLAPRLNSVNPQPYHIIIYDLIERCLLDHPHHVLPVLLALKNSYKDAEYSEDPVSMSQAKAANDPYVVTAKRMLDSVIKKGHSDIVNIIKETEQLSVALISLANFKVRNPKALEQPVPKTESLKKIKNLKHAIIPTVTIPVKADCNYKDVPSVVCFSDKFLMVGGINAPKKLGCKGSDGIERPVLLKGEDDIRQDAVMQQVFVIVNQLLAGHQHRDTRRLLIRTYKAVALSRRSGIIEWCDGTEPLGKLLVGNNYISGLHGSIRPGDISAKDARKMMDEKRTATNDDKLKVFKKVLTKLRPVFHYFFFQNFLVPAVWYEKKLAYTYSVATSSMIGYILGLGDRHVQNILIDKSTGEVIHIDLGIAFEQGRVQPTPETVPFRLTQDMVAGLGATGVEGVFARCCEKTMDVLRSNKDTLLTILEVLLCDPLYMWTISPREAYSKQDLPVPTTSNYTEAAGGSGSEAERALLRVNNKLDGTEFGSTLATPGQVARLIQQATDINNLSRLFPGWQPYL